MYFSVRFIQIKANFITILCTFLYQTLSLIMQTPSSIYFSQNISNILESSALKLNII